MVPFSSFPMLTLGSAYQLASASQNGHANIELLSRVMSDSFTSLVTSDILGGEEILRYVLQACISQFMTK